ncbi:MAG TPA: SDR family oxidoreductase [Candidatus Angelobacter sp.]|nr:SDR family oxidoreductase [Candidatus Angelobacter sp.]
MRSLIIGGTRNLGPSIVQVLLEQGHKVTAFNRGVTHDDLPEEVERLRGDRTNPRQLKQAFTGKDFDLVVDTALYTGAEAEAVIEMTTGHVGRYVFLSTGQVYLVRIGAQRPYKEEDYAGPVMPEPSKSDESAHSNWLYGFDKRAAEDVFALAWAEKEFPFTSLRLPMVNSERDHYGRIYGYFLRLQDGGPIVIPEGDGLPVRHVYGEDVAQAIMKLAGSDVGKGRAYNIGQDETVTLEKALEMLAELMHRQLKIVRVPRAELERRGLLPDCSPFSGKWMSSLDNVRSKTELGITYTPMCDYLKKLVSYYQAALSREIAGYAQRAKELELIQTR